MSMALMCDGISDVMRDDEVTRRWVRAVILSGLAPESVKQPGRYISVLKVKNRVGIRYGVENVFAFGTVGLPDQ